MKNDDRFVIHLVAAFIGVIALALAIGLLVLNYQGKSIDALLATLAGTAVGSLVTLLTSTSGRTPAAPAGTPADPVSVQTADKPLDVTPVPAEVHPDAPAESDL